MFAHNSQRIALFIAGSPVGLADHFVAGSHSQIDDRHTTGFVAMHMWRRMVVRVDHHPESFFSKYGWHVSTMTNGPALCQRTRPNFRQ